MKRDNVIFDFDGTLADSAVLTIAVFKKVAPEFGLPVPDYEHLRSCIGYANPEFYNHIYPDQPAELVRLVGEKVERLESEMLADFEGELLFPGCKELLKRLEALGISIYIASTADKGHILPIMEKTGITHFFKEIFCDEPDKTEMLQRIILDTNKGKFIMVGDMVKDSSAARTNGIFSVGACYGYCIKEKSNFDAYINTPAELLEYL